MGRADDLAAVARRVEEERLVTILGPGGIGKTRLALRFAEERVEAYAAHRGGGVWFCDLSDASDASDIASTVAAAVGIELEGEGRGASLAERVGRAIARRGRILIVLDNFEAIVAHAAETVGHWLRIAPSARFLVTSRVALDLTGEQLWSLSPLGRDDAIELFDRRARGVRPSFEARSEHETVGAIVDAIDRMPLAIELAATRIAVLSASQLHERLTTRGQDNKRTELLAGGREVGRHASMRRTVLDSIALLEPGPRRLFELCSSMRNGFTLDAAEAVMGKDVLDDLGTLVRHSLLRCHVEPGDVARYGYFELIREVATELAPEERSAIDRYVAHHAAQGARTPPRIEDLENLHHAYDCALASEPPAATQALAIALAMDPLLSRRGQLPVLARMLDDALAALAKVGGEPSIEGHLARGIARRERGESAGAREDFEGALAIARERGETGLAAVALTRLGGMSDVAGDTEAARAQLDEALRLLATTDGTRVQREAEAYLLLGHARRRQGALDAARSAAQLSAERYRALAHDEGLGAALYELGVVAMFAGAQEEAFAHYDEGLLVAERAGLRVVAGALKTARGCLLQDLERLDEALAHHAEAARIFGEAGARHREASALYYLATTYLERGEPGEAEVILRSARAPLEGVGAIRYEALIDACVASACAATGDLARAEAALERAERVAERVETERALVVAVKIHRLAFEHRRAALAEREGGEKALARAEAMVAESPSDDSRFAFRILRGVLRSDRPAPRSDALVVERGGRAFRRPGDAEVVELPVRSPLRRLLEHLAQRRIEAPGEVVTIETIIEVGWPGERIASEAALNRAYVALASLRKLGLRGLLLHGGGGYAISQALVVRLENKV